MKILGENQKQGEITLKIENLNDLWTLYNIISTDDEVSARTHRRVILKEGSKGERKPMYLKLKVKDTSSVSFHEFSNRLRVKGTILEGPEDFVSFGTYHTFNIEPGQKLTITKKIWLKSEIRRLEQVSVFEGNFVMLFIAMETGLATISIITNFSQKRIATIKKTIPGKRYEQTHRNQAITEFYSEVKKILEVNMNEYNLNLIIICGPGNTRDYFIKYLKEKSNPPYISKIKSIHASSGTESAIFEALKSKEVSQIKKNIKIFQEAEKIEEILSLFSTDADLIAIGIDEISNIANHGAVKELFIVDILIRGVSKENKLKIEEIITNVENSGGKIYFLNSEHSTGQQLIDLGSLVAILRYKS